VPGIAGLGRPALALTESRTPSNPPISRRRSHRRRVTSLNFQILHAPPLLAIVGEPHQIWGTSGNVQAIQTAAESASFGFQHRFLSGPPPEERRFFFAWAQREQPFPLGVCKESGESVHGKIEADFLHIHTHLPAGCHRQQRQIARVAQIETERRLARQPRLALRFGYQFDPICWQLKIPSKYLPRGRVAQTVTNRVLPEAESRGPLPLLLR